MLAFSSGTPSLTACYCQQNLKPVTLDYHPSVRSLLEAKNQQFRNKHSSQLRNVPFGKRSNFSLSCKPKDFEENKKKGNVGLPPFKINDKSALLTEIGLIFISQLLIGLNTTLNSPTFTGWMSPVTADTLTAPNFVHCLTVSFGLSFFWIISRWWSRSLESDVFFFRLKDAFDATWQQWIAVANLYIASSLAYSFVNHVGVSGIETPLLSGAVAILVARVLYYGIPI